MGQAVTAPASAGLLRLQMALHPDLLACGKEKNREQHEPFLFRLYLFF